MGRWLSRQSAYRKELRTHVQEAGMVMCVWNYTPVISLLVMVNLGRFLGLLDNLPTLMSSRPMRDHVSETQVRQSLWLNFYLHMHLYTYTTHTHMEFEDMTRDCLRKYCLRKYKHTAIMFDIFVPCISIIMSSGRLHHGRHTNMLQMHGAAETW